MRLLQSSNHLLVVTSNMLWLLLLTGCVRAAPVQQQHTQPLARLLLHYRQHADSTSSSTQQPDTYSFYGNFSPVGLIYPFEGDVVQVHAYRACERNSLGTETRLLGNVAVVLGIQPYISGCVSLKNQAKFAQASGASALIIGPVSSDSEKYKLGSVDMPVVVISETEAVRLQQVLDQAGATGARAHMALSPVPNAHLPVPPQHTQLVRSAFQLDMTVFYRPHIFDVGILIAIVLMLFFGSVTIYLKIRWQQRRRRELSLRSLAKSALSEMETRRWTTSKTQQHRGLNVWASLLPHKHRQTQQHSTSHSVVSVNDTCAICLDDYQQGQELRVLFCGHEFHSLCVDPWLLGQHSCPLCQYDVIYHTYPGGRELEPCKPLPPPIAADAVSHHNEQPLLSTANEQHQHQPQQQQQQQQHSRRKQLRLSRRLPPADACSSDGYVSDVSSASTLPSHNAAKPKVHHNKVALRRHHQQHNSSSSRHHQQRPTSGDSVQPVVAMSRAHVDV